METRLNWDTNVVETSFQIEKTGGKPTRSQDSSLVVEVMKMMMVLTNKTGQFL
jgi:hypothetical protein